MNEALNIVRNKAEKTVWDKRDGSVRILDKSDLCPISKNWLIPANCTEIKPPEIEEGYRVFFENNEWHIEKTEELQEEEIKMAQGSVVELLQEQIQELQSQIEELKFEKNEVKLDMKLEKEKLYDDIANVRAEKERLFDDIASARAEALELSANLILQKEELKKDTEGVDDNGFKTDI